MATDRVRVSSRRVEPWIGREMAGEHDVERFFGSSSFPEVEHPSRILRTRSEWRHRCGELYDDMIAKDAHLAGLELKRTDAVLGLPRRLEPGDPSPQALQARDLCRWALSKISALSINYRHQLGCVGRGIAFEELVWEKLARGPWAGATVPVAIFDRPMWRFAFEPQTHALHVRRPSGIPVPAPPAKFQIARYGTKDNPWGGQALLDSVYWYWFLKHHGWKFWAVFVEKYAMPTTYTQYKHRHGDETANQERQAEALAIAEGVQSEYALSIPDDVILALLEATRSGGISYETFTDSCNRAMSMLYLGEINTSGLRPGVGAFASEQVSNEIRLEKVKGDAHDLAACWSDGVLSWITDVNFGPDVAPPKLLIDSVEADDRELRQTGIDRVLAAGQPVPKRYFYLTHQVPMPADGESVVTGPAEAPATLDDVELDR